VAETVRRIGPIQSQTARSPFVGLAARLPGVTHDDVTAAYESLAIVRGSTIRGTVHTCAAEQHPLLDAATRLGQRAVWTRQLKLPDAEVDELWQATERFAYDEWRTPAELLDHLGQWLGRRGHRSADELESGLARYLGFGHGGLVRRPLRGAWSGQGAAGYRTARALLPDLPAAADPLVEAVRVHLASYGPATRRDVAWWSGLGLRQVDTLLERLDGLVWADGPGGASYVDIAHAPAPRQIEGVRLLPEFDAVLCGYDPKTRDRFVAPADHEQLWSRANGFMLAPVLVDGRVGGHWRIDGSGRSRGLEVTSFIGARRPRKAELDEPVTALAAALDVRLGSVSVSRA
jgi:hypothetical protein